MKRVFVVCGIALTLIPFAAIAQAPDAEKPSFEVASVKAGEPNDRQSSIRIAPGGRFTTTNIPLKMLIRFAYDVTDNRIVGGPKWMDSDKFSIAAAPAAGSPTPAPEELRVMLQGLLADRFKLTVHKETRELPIYALVVAKNGPKLAAADTTNCPDMSSPNPGPKPGVLPCGGMQILLRRLSGRNVAAKEIAHALTDVTRQPVVDKTGLAGAYDFTLEWAPDESVTMPRGPGETAPPALNSDLPPLFTAIQEQLGLKLESQKGPVEVIVVDGAEQPAED